MSPLDSPLPGSPPNGEPGSGASQPHKRSGSERRQRVFKTDTRWDGFEYTVLREKARDAGLTPNGYIRSLVIGTPGPRAQRTPPVNAELLAHAIAALNKIGGLLNQIARVLNAGGAIHLAGDCYAALTEIRQAARTIRDAVGRKDRDDHQGQSS